MRVEHLRVYDGTNLPGKDEGMVDNGCLSDLFTQSRKISVSQVCVPFGNPFTFSDSISSFFLLLYQRVIHPDKLSPSLTAEERKKATERCQQFNGEVELLKEPEWIESYEDHHGNNVSSQKREAGRRSFRDGRVKMISYLTYLRTPYNNPPNGGTVISQLIGVDDPQFNADMEVVNTLCHYYIMPPSTPVYYCDLPCLLWCLRGILNACPRPNCLVRKFMQDEEKAKQPPTPPSPELASTAKKSSTYSSAYSYAYSSKKEKQSTIPPSSEPVVGTKTATTHPKKTPETPTPASTKSYVHTATPANQPTVTKVAATDTAAAGTQSSVHTAPVSSVPLQKPGASSTKAFSAPKPAPPKPTAPVSSSVPLQPGGTKEFSAPQPAPPKAAFVPEQRKSASAGEPTPMDIDEDFSDEIRKRKQTSSVPVQKRYKKTMTIEEKQQRCTECQRHPTGIGCKEHHSDIQNQNRAQGKTFGWYKNRKTKKQTACRKCIAHGYFCLDHLHQDPNLYKDVFQEFGRATANVTNHYYHQQHYQQNTTNNNQSFSGANFYGPVHF